MTRKPIPGSQPLPKFDAGPPERDGEVSMPNLERMAARAWPAWEGPRPPWMTQDPQEIAAWNEQLEQREADEKFTALQKARQKAEELAGAIRSAAFDDWISRCTKRAQEPSEWTQARVLYQSYLAHAKAYGRNRAQQRLSVQELATETQWGRMMATLYPNKKRRRAGWYYPLKRKRGA